MTERVRVLLVLANAKDSQPLALDEEVRTIAERLSRAGVGHLFQLDPRSSVRATDLSDHLLETRPHVLHFSGHGNPNGDLVVESDDGSSGALRIEALAELIDIAGRDLRYVVLNACHSAVGAAALLPHVDAVVGTTRAIDDPVAVRFAAGFYRGLAHGLDVDRAFRLGCNEIDLVNLPQSDVPALLLNPERRTGEPLIDGVGSSPFVRIASDATGAATARLPDQPQSNSGLARSLVDLHVRLRECHEAYERLIATEDWDAHRVWHEAVNRLGVAMAPLARTLGIWDGELLSHLRAYLDHESDAVALVGSAIGASLPSAWMDRDHPTDSGLGADFALAVESLGSFIRNNFTLDQIFAASSERDRPA